MKEKPKWSADMRANKQLSGERTTVIAFAIRQVYRSIKSINWIFCFVFATTVASVKLQYAFSFWSEKKGKMGKKQLENNIAIE